MTDPTSEPPAPSPYVYAPSGTPPVDTPAKKKPPTWLVVVVFLILLGCCGGGIAIVATSHTPKVAAAPAETITPTATRIALATIRQWVDNGGLAHVNALSADFTTIQTASSNQDLPGLRAGCVSLQGDVTSAEAYGPIPDESVQGPWSVALVQFAASASDCIAGADGRDVNLLTRSITEMQAGTASLNETTAAVAKATG